MDLFGGLLRRRAAMFVSDADDALVIPRSECDEEPAVCRRQQKAGSSFALRASSE
jgi:hypothetical protein